MYEDEEFVLELTKPVTIGKGDGAVTYTEIKLRQPEGGELEKASRADTAIGTNITLISLITKMPRGAIEKLGQRDLMAASRYLGSFTNGGQAIPTGGED